MSDPVDDTALAERARELVRALAANAFEEVVGRFDATMRGALPAEKLGATWEAVSAQTGPFEDVEATQVARGPAGQAMVVATTRFARARLDVRVAFDAEGKVAGLFFVPAAAPYNAPSYVDAAAFDTQSVTIGQDPWKLPGTLLVPKVGRPAPAVVLVHGSGPNDRDETVGANRPFADIAGGLASRGVAVLRYDKRTRVHGAAMAADDGITVEEEAIADALAAVAFLRTVEGVDPTRVVVAGHSLGGQLAPRIATRDPSIAGIALLAGSTRSIPEMIVEQLAYLASHEPPSEAMTARLAGARTMAARVEALADGAEPEPGERVFGAGAPYWRDLAAYDALTTAAALPIPVFVAQGGRDYQVTHVDFVRWREALAGRPKATFHLYPEANHLFGAGEGVSLPGEYQRRGEVVPALIEDLVSWIATIR